MWLLIVDLVVELSYQKRLTSKYQWNCNAQIVNLLASIVLSCVYDTDTVVHASIYALRSMVVVFFVVEYCSVYLNFKYICRSELAATTTTNPLNSFRTVKFDRAGRFFDVFYVGNAWAYYLFAILLDFRGFAIFPRDKFS